MWNWVVSAAGARGDAGAVRRLALSSRPRRSLADSGARAPGGVRNQREVPQRAGESRVSARGTCSAAPPRQRAFHRIAAGAVQFRFRLRAHSRRTSNCPPIAGGTDIIGCFISGNPMLPVYRGELQCAALGLAVDVFDDEGRPGARAKGRTGVHGALPVDAGVVLGRSRRRDVPRRLFRALSRCLVSRRLRGDDPGRRFHHPRPLGRHTESGRRAHRHFGNLPDRGGLRGDCRSHRGGPGLGGTCGWCSSFGCSPDTDWTTTWSNKFGWQSGAMPARGMFRPMVLETADIPRTRSGKIVELAVREAIHGRAAVNADALANPEALDYFRNRVELTS